MSGIIFAIGSKYKLVRMRLIELKSHLDPSDDMAKNPILIEFFLNLLNDNGALPEPASNLFIYLLFLVSLLFVKVRVRGEDFKRKTKTAKHIL